MYHNGTGPIEELARASQIWWMLETRVDFGFGACCGALNGFHVLKMATVSCTPQNDIGVYLGLDIEAFVLGLNGECWIPFRGLIMLAHR